MSVTILAPRYSHRKLSDDEKVVRRIADPLNPAETLPQMCGDCGTKGSIRNPLMMKPLFRMDHGGPKGTLYQARCSDCQIKRVRRH